MELTKKTMVTCSLLLVLISFMIASQVFAVDCSPGYPNPVIQYNGKDTEGRISIPVTNYSSYSNDLFTDYNASSRTTVWIYNGETNVVMYGFIRLKSRDALKDIWFSPPGNWGHKVYIIMKDLVCNKEYKSNTLNCP